MIKKKKILSMDELVANAEKVLKGKTVNSNGKKLFEKTLKKPLNNVIQNSFKHGVLFVFCSYLNATSSRYFCKCFLET